MREYWKLDYYINDHHKIRYFYGTEAKAKRRTIRYNADKADLVKLTKSQAEFLKTEKNIHFSDLS